MLSAALKALEDVLSPNFRGVLWKSLGLTVVLFVVIMFALQVVLQMLTLVPWPWLETVIEAATALGVLVVMFFLIAPVTAIFAGLFLDEIADLIERRDYPMDRPGKPLTFTKAFFIALQFGSLVLLVNLILLPTLFFGIGVVLMTLANAYFLGREYFGAVAMRHMSVRQANELRRENAGRVFAAGLIPAGLAVVPVVNIIVPLFATSYFVHIFKKVSSQSV